MGEMIDVNNLFIFLSYSHFIEAVGKGRSFCIFTTWMMLHFTYVANMWMWH
jgi:hypothetical protein